MRSISRVRHEDKYQCVKLCIQKENEGFQCVQPIRKVYQYYKQFKRDGKFYDYHRTDDISYYEAVYEKKLDEVV